MYWVKRLFAALVSLAALAGGAAAQFDKTTAPYGLRWGMSTAELTDMGGLKPTDEGGGLWRLAPEAVPDLPVNVMFVEDRLDEVYSYWACEADLDWCQQEYRRASMRLTIAYGAPSPHPWVNGWIQLIFKQEGLTPHATMPPLFFHRWDTDVLLFGWADEDGSLWLKEYYTEGELTDGEAIGALFYLWEERVAPALQQQQDLVPIPQE